MKSRPRVESERDRRTVGQKTGEGAAKTLGMFLPLGLLNSEAANGLLAHSVRYVEEERGSVSYWVADGVYHGPRNVSSARRRCSGGEAGRAVVCVCVCVFLLEAC